MLTTWFATVFCDEDEEPEEEEEEEEEDEEEEEEEPVDNRPELEEFCKTKCVKTWVSYQECVERIEKDTTGEAHCTGQYFDYYACVDKCVAPKLFNSLK